jgi:hypothetical protein
MRKPVLLVLLVVLGLSVAACGSSGSDDASDETTTTAAADDAGDDAADETTTTQGGEPGEDGEPGDDEVPEPVDVSEEEYVDALTTNLSSGSEDDGDLVLSDEEAACLAPQWVDAITVDLLQQQGVTVEDLSDPGFDGADLGMELAQGEAMVAAFGACDIDVVHRRQRRSGPGGGPAGGQLQHRRQRRGVLRDHRSAQHGLRPARLTGVGRGLGRAPLSDPLRRLRRSPRSTSSPPRSGIGSPPRSPRPRRRRSRAGRPSPRASTR